MTYWLVRNWVQDSIPHNSAFIFWFELFLEARAEILRKLFLVFGRFEDTEKIFRNQLTFIWSRNAATKKIIFIAFLLGQTSDYPSKNLANFLLANTSMCPLKVRVETKLFNFIALRTCTELTPLLKSGNVINKIKISVITLHIGKYIIQY